MDYESALARVIDDVVEPGAAAVDRDGSFPRAQLDALGEAGILGLASSPDVGGGGGDLARRRRPSWSGSPASAARRRWS